MRHQESARRVLAIESQALQSVSEHLDGAFDAAVDLILGGSGRVIVSGMGKSGIVGRKISATLASTGTPSFFLHPSEAFHGDLGMVTPEDCFLAISHSGETEEVVRLLPFITESGNGLIALTGRRTSTLAVAADVHVFAGVPREACPLQLAPTASTTAALALGDALAVALMEARDFRPENFARLHPGGSLGRRLLSTVDDLMQHTRLPVVRPEADVLSVVGAMAEAGLGLAVVVGEHGLAVITDGDIRRALKNAGKEIFSQTAQELMTREPVTVSAGTRSHDAFQLMERAGVAALLVTDPEGSLIGVLKK